MTVKQAARQFLDHLMLANPVENVDVSLHFIRNKQVDTCEFAEALALCSMNTDDRTAKLEISSHYKGLKDTLTVVGHEYFHVVQWFRDGRHVSLDDGIMEYVDYEGDAEYFGRQQAKAYMLTNQLEDKP